MEQSFVKLIDSVQSPLILLPTNPFFDQVASGLALYLSLKDKKPVSISCSTPMVVEHNRLVGVDKITPEIGDKNLVIKFKDYEASEIERVSYDIEGGQFRLTVIPKPQVTPPIKDQIELSYAGVSSDTVILVGGYKKAHFPALESKDLVTTKVVHVGIRNLEDAQDLIHMAFVRLASSISEVVTGLIRAGGFELNEDIATNLLMGIEDGSKNFSSEGVSAETFAIISELMRAGGRRVSKDAVKPKMFPQGVIPRDFPKDFKKQEPPKSWLGPKIYKGTSIS